MADKNEKTIAQTRKEVDDLRQKTSLMIYGADTSLSDESELISSIVRDTRIKTAKKFGARTEGNLIDYYSNVSISDLFQRSERSEQGDEEPDKSLDFKKYLEQESISGELGMLGRDVEKNTLYGNYETMYKHIPEIAQGLDLIKDSILSPDDFTKMIFDVYYDESGNTDEIELINKKLNKLTEKYDIEILTDELVTNALLYGESYLSVLSLNDELETMLADPVMAGNTGGILTESDARMADLERTSIELNYSDTDHLTSKDIGVLAELFNIGTEEESDKVKMITERNQSEKIEIPVKEKLIELFNENFIVGSKKEFLIEEADFIRESHSREDLEKMFKRSQDKNKSKGKKKQKKDTEPLYINGSVLDIINPLNMVELRVNNTIYGYYYFEEMDGSNLGYVSDGGASLQGPTDGIMFKQPLSAGVGGNTHFSKDIDSMTTKQKERTIAKIFAGMVSKKLNKDFIRNNKDLVDYIYNLVKHGYILEKPVKMIYYKPEDIISFNVPAVFRKITFFSRLYISVLTNTMLIKLGRGHDKRIYYIETGADSDYENELQEIARNLKTKDFTMSDVEGDINNVLRMNPGRFHDYFLPMINGERVIDIDTIQGMNSDEDNDFLEFLKDSMLSGMGVPRSYIDNLRDVDFARTVAVQNSNFARMIIKYQKLLQGPFTKLYRRLYENEYKYFSDQESGETDSMNLSKIVARFPSPVALNQTNLSEQISVAAANADMIAQSMVAPGEINSEAISHRLRKKIMKDFVPGVDWETYAEYLKEAREEVQESEIKSGRDEEARADQLGFGPDMY